MTTRRSILAGAAGLAAAPFAARAREPTRPIQLIVGFPPGGGTDLQARALAEAASRFFPTPIVVMNRAGAGGAIAAQQVAGMAPDGLNLLVGGGSESTSLAAFRDLPCDPKRAFRASLRRSRPARPSSSSIRNGAPPPGRPGGGWHARPSRPR